MKIDFKGAVDETGKLTIFGRDSMVDILKQHAGKPVVIRLLIGRNRSNKVNAYYWACLQMIVIELLKHRIKTDSDTLHWKFKMDFNPEYIKDDEGTIIDKIPGTTTELDNEEFFDDYMSQIREWAANNLNMRLPMPNEKLTFFNET